LMAHRNPPARIPNNRSGFTMSEIFVVMAIMVLMTTIVVSSVIATAEQGKVHVAKSNLYAILSAQQSYYESTGGWNGGSYCIGGCGNGNASLNNNLSLSINDSFTYICTNNTLPYICTATDGVVTLTLNPTTVSPNPMVTCAPAGPNCPLN
jgi:type II secretory pathway pseudopilin PulG